MSNVKKLMMTAAGGDVLNVEDVFSTYVYPGNGTSQNIVTNIDLANEGGLVWTKMRTNTNEHVLVDTERGVNIVLKTNSGQGNDTAYSMVTAFNSDGHSIGTQDQVNSSLDDFVSWTFRKAPKFFDIVTYTGNGVAGRTVSHNLGSTPGAIFVKRTDSTANWASYHRKADATAPEDKYVFLNFTNAVFDSSAYWNDTAPTSTDFTVGDNITVNTSGYTYIAYLFAHNDGDGEFGPNGNQDIIKCGSYTGTGASGNEIDLGFEAQWVLVKSTSSANWVLHDTMRGMSRGGDRTLYPNTSDQEYLFTGKEIIPNASGFTVNGNNTDTNTTNLTYMYIAIRRGQMATPESASEVFGLNQYSGNGQVGRLITSSGDGVVDMAFINHGGGLGSRLATRLRGYPYIIRNDFGAEINSNTRFKSFDDNNGFYIGNNSQVNSPSYTYLAAMWTRAHGYFDVVEYKGSGGTATKDHNLGVVPEMMWLKNRNDTDGWGVYHKDVGATKTLSLDSHNGALTNSLAFNNTAPTETQFTVGSTFNFSSSFNFTAMLFASVSGVSKVGSYTGNGTSQTIDCGFSSGASYVLVKRTTTTTTGNWVESNSEYGIVAGNEKAWLVNTGGDTATHDYIDPANSGFIVNQDSSTNINVNNADYIFYAIAAI
jgi:hypothetical protein